MDDREKVEEAMRAISSVTFGGDSVPRFEAAAIAVKFCEEARMNEREMLDALKWWRSCTEEEKRSADFYADLESMRKRADVAERGLAEAAREINCAGPIAHRIRVLKREHAEKLVEADREAAYHRGQDRMHNAECIRLGEKLKEAQRKYETVVDVLDLFNGWIEVNQVQLPALLGEMVRRGVDRAKKEL